MKIIHAYDLPEVTWKNGGGVTREIAVAHEGEQVLWRLSLADITADGPFSLFGGLTRVLTVVEGAGMTLKTPHNYLRAEVHKPVSFDGATKIYSTLNNGSVRALNLMFDPLKCWGQVTAIQGSYPGASGSALNLMSAVFCTKGTVKIGGQALLRRGSIAMAGTKEMQFELDAAASALVIAITKNP